MLADFLGFINANHLVKHGDRILLAVSGGIDSMVMAHLFHHLPFEHSIAHCNFSLRGAESDHDEQLVREFAHERNIPFHTIKFNTLSYAKDKGISTQMAARELRYAWFEKIRNENGFTSIAIAHNLDDKIETMIINLVRGTGLAGMTGIKPVSANIIRPLLFATRSKISEYCAYNGVQYREDRSNLETKYTRNKIRHLVIPVLKEINPSVIETLDETSERFAGSSGIVSSYIESLRRDFTETRNGMVAFSLEGVKAHMKNRTILFELFRPYGISSVQLKDLVNIIDGRTGSQISTGTHRIVRNRDEIIVTQSIFHESINLTIDSPDKLVDLPISLDAEILDINDSYRVSPDNAKACLDAEKTVFPLTLRNWRAGDYFFPLGMNGKKKLSDYFTDRKYSIPEKERKLVLESDGKIIWIVGDRIDDRFKITAKTTRAIIFRYQE